MIEIKDRIISLRAEKGMTQGQLAQALKMSPSSIGMYEQGRRKPSYELLEEIADYFNVDMDYLMGRSDIKNKYQAGIKYDWENDEGEKEYNLMKTNEIIRKRRKELGLTLKQVADELGVSESLISRYESNDVKNMGIDKITPLSKVLKCSPAYLMGWEEEKQESEFKQIFHEADFMMIPLYSNISAGYGSIQSEFIEMVAVPNLKPNGTTYFAVRVKGDSMEPKIPNESVIIIKKEVLIESGQIGAFCLNGENLVKQKREIKDRLILHSTNLAYPDRVVSEFDDFAEYGKVVKVLIDL